MPDNGDYTVPIGLAAVAQEGDDLTIVAHSYTVQRALRVADRLGQDGLSVEVIDLRWLRSRLGNQAGAGGDVEQAMAGGEMACIQHEGTEVPRDAPHRLFIAGSSGIGIGQSIQGNSPRPALRGIAGWMPLP